MGFLKKIKDLFGRHMARYPAMHEQLIQIARKYYPPPEYNMLNFIILGYQWSYWTKTTGWKQKY
jgi:hypothetical protein